MPTTLRRVVLIQRGQDKDTWLEPAASLQATRDAAATLGSLLEGAEELRTADGNPQGLLTAAVRDDAASARIGARPARFPRAGHGRIGLGRSGAHGAVGQGPQLSG